MPDLPVDRRTFLAKLGIGSVGAIAAGDFASRAPAGEPLKVPQYDRPKT
jgi:hypothetical protein